PRRAKGRLVVKATRPKAGARRREGARVRIVLTTAKRYRAAKRRALAKKRRALIRKRQAAKRR
ncbi:MAG: MFS transporter, partial [Solirubrobacterales bacterium]|nr:MFS transporter [Solirubrobacterales bacterium]